MLRELTPNSTGWNRIAILLAPSPNEFTESIYLSTFSNFEGSVANSSDVHWVGLLELLLMGNGMGNGGERCLIYSDD